MRFARHVNSDAGFVALVICGLLLSAAPLQGADVEGTIAITRRITRQRVLPASGIYHRGAAVAPAAEDSEFSISELARSAIYLESKTALPGGTATAEMRQEKRLFLPETLVIPVGSTVSFPNLDPIFHNVFSFSRAGTFDLGNYPLGETRKVTFKKPGIVGVFCHLHSNMSASIVVAPNRWCGAPDAQGRYSLKDVPPGDYTLVFWHKTAGFFRRPIRVDAATVTMDFTIPVSEEDSEGGKTH